eukprot:169114_1
MATRSNRIVSQWRPKKKSNRKKKSMDLKSYLKIMKVCITNSNGKVLAHCFSFRTTNKKQVFNNVTESSLLAECKATLNSTTQSEIWTMIIFYHLQSMFEMLHDRYSCSWQSTKTALKLLKDQIIEPTTNNTNKKLFNCNDVWYLPVINSMLRNFTDIAITYYQFLSNFDSASDDIIVTAFGDIMQIVRMMTSDHTNRVNSNANSISINNGKHTLCHGLFFTVNQIIKLCDTINNQTYLNHALQEVDKFKAMWTSFPLSDVVTHLYYKGRFNYQRNNNLIKADEELRFAWKLCHKKGLNRYRILLLLIPINMMLGYLPNIGKIPTSLCDRFCPIVEALKTGNLMLFKRTMYYYQEDFINCGVYLLLSKLDLLVFRSLLNKIYLVRKKMCNNNGIKPHVINLSFIEKAIKIRNEHYLKSKYCARYNYNDRNREHEEIDRDEIECILSTLIFKKLVKGYIAHQNAIVLSTKVAFPEIKSVQNWWKSDF